MRELTLEDITMYCKIPAGTELQEDVSCDSTFMLA